MHSTKCLQLLANKPDKSRYVLNSDDFTRFNSVRKYLYMGDLSIPRESLVTFIDFVASLHLDTLMEDMAANIKNDPENFNIDELIQILCRAIKTQNVCMTNASFERFCPMINTTPVEKILEVVPHLSFELADRLMQTATHADSESEFKLALVLSAWEKSHGGKYNSEYLQLVKHIRFDLITFSDLITKVKPLGLLSGAEYIALLEQKGQEMCARLHAGKKYPKFYVCNIQSPIPDGYRAITDEELLTIEFREAFLEKVSNPFEIIGVTKKEYKFLSTASKNNLICRKYLFEFSGGIINNSVLIKNPKNLTFEITSKYLGKGEHDAFLCVKK